MSAVRGIKAGPASLTALAVLNSQGLDLWPKPDYEFPSLPHDVTELGDEDLMSLYTKLTAYSDYIAGQVACAQVDERDAEKQLSMLENKKMLASDGKLENKVTFARAQVAIDPEVAELKELIEEHHAYRKLIEVLHQNIERDAALISRELTRRTAKASRSSVSRFSA